MPFLSIIIPTFNAAKFIERCLLSVVNQSFFDYEVIVQDGKSEDETISKANQICSQYPFKQIRVFSENDKGIYDAMNKGILKAKGKWLYFLGSDDYLFDRDVLLKLFQGISQEEKKFHLVYGNVRSPFYGDKYEGEFDRYKILKKNICHQAIFYRKDIFELIGMYDSRYKVLADYDFNLRCFFNRKIRHKYIDLMVAHYTEGGVSSTKVDRLFAAIYPTASSRVKKFGYKSLPLRELRPHYDSRTEFFLMIIRRVFQFEWLYKWVA